MRRPSRVEDQREISLALQGGGSHGAFTWGVLDRLLEQDRTDIVAVSGASAGAVNGLLLATGLLHGGRDAAQRTLSAFWQRLASDHGVERLVANSVRRLTRDFSPRLLNPFDVRPLRAIAEEMIDFPALRRSSKTQLFIAACDPVSGAARVFRNSELTIDVLLASTCLPQLSSAVKVGGHRYWDGGFAANPPLLPLVLDCPARDVLLVEVEPPRISELPKTARAIADRLDQLLFRAGLAREVAVVERMQSEFGPLARLFSPAARRLHAVRLHNLAAPEQMSQLGTESKFNTEWRLVDDLYRQGIAVADRWMADELV